MFEGLDSPAIMTAMAFCAAWASGQDSCWPIHNEVLTPQGYRHGLAQLLGHRSRGYPGRGGFSSK